MGYNFTVKWIKGTLNHAPDALTCNLPHTHYHKMASLNMTYMETWNQPYRATSTDRPSCIRHDDLRQHTEADQEYQQLQHYIFNGFPEHRNQLPKQCQRYWVVCSHTQLLSSCDPTHDATANTPRAPFSASGNRPHKVESPAHSLLARHKQ